MARQPQLAAAVLCKGARQNKNGTLDLIGVFSTWTHQVKGAAPPAKMPDFNLEATLVLLFWTADLSGQTELLLEFEGPSGHVDRMPTTLPLRGDSYTHVTTNMNMHILDPGRHFIRVSLAGRHLTKLPVDIRYDHKASGPSLN